MLLQTKVSVPPSPWKIYPTDHLLFVGSCFAANIGKFFTDNMFRTTVNPFGVMYNPASILHTLQRMFPDTRHDENTHDIPVFPIPDKVVITLGTNHIYILKKTGEIVDNCEKRPQSLFIERELSVEECAKYLDRCIRLLQSINPQVRIVLTVSPIRYAKYGFHGNQLSKATLLLASQHPPFFYFPAYEILLDELRDYRFYATDMLHPSEQAVEYICERFADTYFSEEAHRFVEEYRPIRRALNHRPFNPESEEYRLFMEQTQERLSVFKNKYHLPLSD